MDKTKDFIKEAAEIQQAEGNCSEKALEKYKKAIRAFTDGDDEYDLLYAHYQVMWIYVNKYEAEEALPYARKCLELMEPIIAAGAIFHFTEMGKFHEEVIRFASNTLAWHVYENTDDTGKLEKALETVSLGCGYVDDPAYYYLYDTKVRILLELGRKEEAFRIVYDCLKKDPGFSDFTDLKSNKEYRQWKESLETGNIEYTEGEKELLEKAARIHTKLKNMQPLSRLRETTEMTPETVFMNINEISKKYTIPQNYYEEDDCLLLFKGDLQITGNLDDKWYENLLRGKTWKNELYGIVIDGDLVVDGEITIDMPVLHVVKNLTADYLFSGDGHTLIEGDARIKYGVYGQYNDGTLQIDGKLVTPYIIAGDHSMPRKSDEGEFIYIEGGEGDEDVYIGEKTGSGYGWNWHYYDDALRLLAKEVWDDEYRFSVKRFFDLVKQGKNPFFEVKTSK